MTENMLNHACKTKTKEQKYQQLSYNRPLDINPQQR